MPKNKRHKYARVSCLPNVTLSFFGGDRLPCPFPWLQARCRDMEMVLELGCGKGEYSLAFAAACPQTFCVGIDSKSNRICSGAEAAMAQGLENIHFLRSRIEHAGDFFEEHSIHEIWLPFPDPHLKKRAVKNRLTAPSFLSLYARLLVPGGRVFLKTDSDLLYHYTRESVEQWGGRVIDASDNIHGAAGPACGGCNIVSAYEQAARSQGATIKYMVFTLGGNT